MTSKTLSSSLLLFLTIYLISPATADQTTKDRQPPPPDRIATVNGVAIPKSDFDVQFSEAKRRMKQKGESLDDAKLSVLKKFIIDRMIEEELLYQESRKKQITISPEEVLTSINTIKEQYPSEADFHQGLADMNMDESELRSKVEHNLAAHKVIKQEVKTDVPITEEESKKFYSDNPAYFKKPGQVEARHILIKLDQGAAKDDQEKARKKIETIQKQLAEGEDFGKLARQYSEGPSKDKGGSLGYFGPGQMVKPFETAAFSLKKGEISGIVETRFGLHLLQVTDIKPETTVEYPEAKIKITEYLKAKKTKQEVTRYIDSLKKTATIEVY
jgi:peptidyl-prolyl cis-trans isomerase C